MGEKQGGPRMVYQAITRLKRGLFFQLGGTVQSGSKANGGPLSILVVMLVLWYTLKAGSKIDWVIFKIEFIGKCGSEKGLNATRL